MSRFPDVGSRSRRGPAGWLAAGGAVVALAAGAWWLIAPSGAPGAGSAPVTASAGAATVVGSWAVRASGRAVPACARKPTRNAGAMVVPIERTSDSVASAELDSSAGVRSNIM